MIHPYAWLVQDSQKQGEGMQFPNADSLKVTHEICLLLLHVLRTMPAIYERNALIDVLPQPMTKFLLQSFIALCDTLLNLSILYIEIQF